jgi:TM2 domain-containing membrane protein YozV
MAEGRGKEKMIAGILGILLGGLGIHHFYLGSNTAGIILLAVGIVLGTITCGVGYGLAALVGLVEGIMLLIMSDEDFNKRYNQRTPGSTEFVFMKPQM